MKAMDLIRTLPLKGRVEMDIPMKELTTLRVGGKADCVVFAGSESDVEQLALFCADRDVPLTVVGRGSNLLVRDGGLSGVVLLMGKAFADVRVKKNRVYAQAGATLGAAARAAQQAGLAGLEFAEGIPGSVGGGVRMNAGAYGGEMSRKTARSFGWTRRRWISATGTAQWRKAARWCWRRSLPCSLTTGKPSRCA